MLTDFTCGIPVPCDNEALEEFFWGVLLCQFFSMEPNQQHPVPMLFIAVLIYGQTQ